MGMTTRFTYHPGYVDMVVDKSPEFVRNQVTFIRIMGTAGVLSSTRWANTIFNTKVIHELFKELKCGKGY